MNKDTREEKIENKINNLDVKMILKTLYNKELDCKKNILECIELLGELKKQEVSQDKVQGVYTIVYKSIDNMAKIVKPLVF